MPMDNQQEALQQLLALFQANRGASAIPGMPGTPGGPVQESPTMRGLRNLQYGASFLAAPAAASLSYGGLPGAALGAIGLGVAAGQNANSPNIRDVWADQLRMKMQGN